MSRPPAIQAAAQKTEITQDDTALVYTGPIPNPDTITVRSIPESEYKSGVTYVNGRPMNFGAFDSLAPRLHLPRVVKGYCGPDDCGYPWHPRACRELTLYKADSVSADLAGTIAAGDTFTVENSNLHIVSPLKVALTKDYAITEKYDIDGSHGPRPDTVKFAAGDTLYVFEQDQEFLTWWYRGMLGRGQSFWNITDEVSPARTEMWYEVTRPNGSKAWWKHQENDVSSFGSKCSSNPIRDAT
ncbi:MAG TPA: hypothetical protein VJ865_11300 [Gemmatimonadaceae bacterium]|nr:hypothetical protein [Gemmatimonadaceae bacterium]